MIVGLDHVQMAMPRGEEAAARAFYVGLLGMSEVPKPDPLKARGGVWFQAPGTMLHLGVEDPFVPARKAHPAFIVSDLDALSATLQQAGYPVEADATLKDVSRAYTTDPFGNRVELIADGDGFSQRG